MTSNTKPYLRAMNLPSYINSVKERDNNHAIIKPSGEYVYLCNGIEIPGFDFEKANPLPVPDVNRDKKKGEQKDGRTNWI